MSKTIISVIGPTGIGKTKLAIELAKMLNTEIISCDARQFFKEMKIGTATPDEDELSQAKHHFIGNLSVEDEYSIGQYEIDALKKAEELFQKYNEIVLVGGSGMYEKALLEGLHDLPEANEANQKKLHQIWKNEGIEKLQELLKNEDETYFQKVDKDNPRRLMRALDVIWQTGKSYTENISSPTLQRNFKFLRIALEAERETIYERINKRVDLMMQKGLLEEAQKLLPFRHKTALQTVGYSELFQYFDGIFSLDVAMEEIKKNSRRYAKRQTTWNKKLEHVYPLYFQYSQKELQDLLTKILS